MLVERVCVADGCAGCTLLRFVAFGNKRIEQIGVVLELSEAQRIIGIGKDVLIDGFFKFLSKKWIYFVDFVV